MLYVTMEFIFLKTSIIYEEFGADRHSERTRLGLALSLRIYIVIYIKYCAAM